MKEKNILIHFILENELLFTRLASHVPRINDEMRFGDINDERFYKVDRVCWVYDETKTPYERVNIGISNAT